MPGIYGDQRVTLRKGMLSRRPYGSTGPFFPFGSCSAMDYGFELEEFSVPFQQAAGGGDWWAKKRAKSLTMNITMVDFTPENEALANAGTATAEASGTATDEEITLYAGANMPLAHIPTAITAVKVKAGTTAPARANSTAYLVGDVYVPATPNGHFYKVTVAGTSASAPPTFTTDGTTFADGTATVQDMGLIDLAAASYTRSRGGVYVADSATFAGITATQGVVALVTYSYPAIDRVDAMTGVGQEWELYYEAHDEAQAGEVARGWFRRVTFGPAQTIGLLHNEPGEMAITGTGQADPNITALDESRFCYFERKAA